MAAARAVGAPVRDPRVLDTGSNTVVLLAPGGPVARVAALTATARDAHAAFTREVAVARALSAAGAPVVAPWTNPGPFRVEGEVVSLWTLAADGPAPSGAALGRALRACHAALRDATLTLPPLADLLDESRRVAARAGLTAAERALADRAFDRALATALPVQPVHGDAGLGNVLAGPRWIDWEDACLGPVEWDLAALVTSARMGLADRDRAEAALAAYGAPAAERLEPFVAARAAHTAAWSALSRFGDADRRLAWLRQHRLGA